jgi:hypothetical protein
MDSSGVPWISPVALWEADRKAKLCIGQLSFGKVKHTEVLIIKELKPGVKALVLQMTMASHSVPRDETVDMTRQTLFVHPVLNKN